jgi:IclR family acetate operon transcriptional repressor
MPAPHTPSEHVRIQSLARASAILDVIADGGAGGIGLGEISRQTNLHKTTAFNLLASLLTLRLVEQDSGSKRYRLGMRNIELGRIAQRRLHIPTLARPVLADLCRVTNETVNLGLPDLLDIMVVDSINGSRFLQATAYVGSRSPYHCTALGKAVLAHRDAPMRQSIYRACAFSQLTPHTIIDVDALEAQLPAVISQGYAVDLEENEIGVNCIGAPIFNGFGEVAGAISITGPSSRMTAASFGQLAPDLIAAANAVSSAIGGGAIAAPPQEGADHAISR